MEEILKSLLLGSDGLVAYLTVFGVLLACGLGVPLPEDISLLLGGYLAHHGAANLYGMMAVGFVGILAGDSLIYFAGRRIGTRVGQKPGFFARIVTPEKRARVEGLFATHGQKIVCAARFLPGVRAVTFFTAGSAGMGYWRFVFWDGLAALLSAPVFVWLGWYFGGDLDALIQKLKDGQMTVIGALGLVAIAYLGYRVRKARNAKRVDQAALTAAAQVAARNELATAPASTQQNVPAPPANSAQRAQIS
ncbi:MAG: DedA family protein [Myxococcaceae bacterium]